MKGPHVSGSKSGQSHPDKVTQAQGGGDWRMPMLEALTPAPDYPNYCDAIELGGHVFAVDETDGSTYFWDTANGIFSVLLHCMIHCLNQ